MFLVVQMFFICLPLILQMFEIVSLADDLLPHMPARIIKLPTYYHAYKGSSTKKSASIKEEGAGSTGNERSGRERLLREQPELLQQFGMDLLPTMTQVSAGILLLTAISITVCVLSFGYFNSLCACSGVWF